MFIRTLLVVCTVAAAMAAPTAQTLKPSDLDAFMARVLTRRDDNWKKLQQYVLDERETFQLIGPGGTPLYGSRREYLWFPRDGVFIKSPVRVDGVTLSEAERRKAEADWLKQEEAREKRRQARAAKRSPDVDDTTQVPLTEDGVRQALEPGFVSAAYFLKFKFDPGQYALVGRDTLEGRRVLLIEYYPTKLFTEGRSRPNSKAREKDPDVAAKMNKVAQVNLWIDPDAFQILRYEFKNVSMDFMPGRMLVRVDALNASMEMGQPFPDVWLPRAIRAAFDLSLASGELNGRFATEYYDYRLASVATRIR